MKRHVTLHDGIVGRFEPGNHSRQAQRGLSASPVGPPGRGVASGSIGLIALTLSLATGPAWGGTLFWTDPGNARIQKARSDGSNIRELTPDRGDPMAVSVDPQTGMIYWVEYLSPTQYVFRRADNAFSVVEDLFGTSIPPNGIAFAFTQSQYYFISNSIERADLTGGNPQPAVTPEPGEVIAGIALDELNGKIYWTDTGLKRIRRANLDGSGAETVISRSPTQKRLGVIALDLAANRVYWAEHLNDSTILRANTDGTSIQTLLYRQWDDSLPALALDSAAGVMYWFDGSSYRGEHDLGRANLDGTAMVQVRYIWDISGYPSIAIDVSPGKVLWTGTRREGLPQLARVNSDGSEATTLWETMRLRAWRIAADVNRQRLYFADLDRIATAGFDGSDVTIIFNQISGTVYDLAVHSFTGDLYVLQSTPGSCTNGYSEYLVVRATPDDATYWPIVWDACGAKSLALDELTGTLYWSEAPNHRVERVKLDGSSRQTFVDLGSETPVGIAIDPVARRLYWIGGSAIRRRALDGGVIQNVVTIPSSPYGAPESLSVDGEQGRLFISTSAGHILQVDTDGSNLIPLVQDPSIAATDVVFVPSYVDSPRNRYISFEPQLGPAVAYQVSMSASETFPQSVGVLGWVGAPEANGVSAIVPAPVFRAWTEDVIDIGDCRVVPASVYELRATQDGVTFDPPTTVATAGKPAGKFWGDTVGAFTGFEWSPPNGEVNVNDFLAAARTFQAAPGAPHRTWVDVHDQTPNGVVNLTDVFLLIKAFQGDPYPFADPAECP
ncbi:MAG: hypothetical protein HY763_06430 [Planctomycetes bacterium]|nr:hypothetical protein [Planctomycetota bacterium]